MCFDVKFLGVAAVFLAILSCSVKEDRAECPCSLTLDFGNVDAAGLVDMGLETMDVAICAGSDFSTEEELALGNFIKEYSFSVPRTELDLLVVCADGGRVSVEEGIVIPEGSECPMLYMFSDKFSADAEQMVKTVALHRNFCVLSVGVKTSYLTRQRPFSIRAEGNVCGVTMEGSLSEGAFSCSSGRSKDGLCQLRIPRQKDGSLLLVVDFLDAEELRTFPIGEYIIESGYDWSSEDLEDIYVEMDFTHSGLNFSISKWKKTLSFEMTI